MATAAQRERAWENKLSAEMRADYFADLAGAFHFRQRAATWMTLFCSSGALVTALSRLPPELTWLAILMPLLAAATSFYSVVAQNQKSAVEASDLHFKWNRLFLECRDLWEAVQAGTAADVATQLARLDDKAADLSKSATSLPYSEKRMLKWYDVVLKQQRLA